ncbi:SDR family oxidoreductase [Alcaligenaceae bacterium]|nr:SDR family oxidoreductase [Alcaligenaceae bacterium]
MNDTSRPLAGRVALVTGSGRNVGAAIAMHLSRAGAAVAVNGHRDTEALQRIEDRLRERGGQACVAIGNVGKSAEVDRMVRHIEETLGSIDIVVSNAAIRPMHALLDITDEDWNRVIATNLSASFFLARRTLPGMLRNKWGRFIHISGLDGFTGHMPLRAHNVACKAGVVALAKAIAREFGGQGITANTVAPGAIDTERDWSQYAHFDIDEVLKDIPVSRLGTVDDVAQACVYLSTDAASFVSGQTIHVNGGQYMF